MQYQIREIFFKEKGFFSETIDLGFNPLLSPLDIQKKKYDGVR